MSSLTGLHLFYNLFSTNMLSLTGQSQRLFAQANTILVEEMLAPRDQKSRRDGINEAVKPNYNIFSGQQ
jgi:hypothetical protein